MTSHVDGYMNDQMDAWAESPKANEAKADAEEAPKPAKKAKPKRARRSAEERHPAATFFIQIGWCALAILAIALLFMLIGAGVAGAYGSPAAFGGYWGDIGRWVFLAAVLLGVAGTIYWWIEIRSKKSKFFRDSPLKALGSAEWLVDQFNRPGMSMRAFEKTYPRNGEEPGFLVLMQRNKKNRREWDYYKAPKKHLLAFAQSGGGKSQKIVIPSIIANAKLGAKAPQLLVVDPKGEIHEKTRATLDAEGYETFVLELRNAKRSHRWNPLGKIYDLYKSNIYDRDPEVETRIDALITQLGTAMVTSKDPRDETWSTGARSIFTGGIWALLQTTVDADGNFALKKEDFTISRVLMNVRSGEEYHKFIEEQNKQNPNNNYYRLLKSSLLVKAAEQRDGYLGNLNQLNIFHNKTVGYVTSGNDFELADLLNRKTALFIIVPDEEKSTYPIITLLVDRMYVEAIETASRMRGKELARTLQMYIEETANVPRITDLETKISAARSRGVFFLLVLQSLKQLNEKYGHSNAETILNNLQVHVYISVNSEDSAKLAQRFGKKTVIKRSMSAQDNQGFGAKRGGGSYSEHIDSMDLITAEQVESLKDPFGFIVSAKTRPALVKFGSAYQNEDIWPKESYEIPEHDIEDPATKRARLARRATMIANAMGFVDLDDDGIPDNPNDAENALAALDEQYGEEAEALRRARETFGGLRENVDADEYVYLGEIMRRMAGANPDELALAALERMPDEEEYEPSPGDWNPKPPAEAEAEGASSGEAGDPVSHGKREIQSLIQDIGETEPPDPSRYSRTVEEEIYDGGA